MVLGGGALSYERGTPVGTPDAPTALCTVGTPYVPTVGNAVGTVCYKRATPMPKLMVKSPEWMVRWDDEKKTQGACYVVMLFL